MATRAEGSEECTQWQRWWRAAGRWRAVMRLRKTEEAADDDRQTGCGVHMPDVLGQQAGGAAKGGELV